LIVSLTACATSRGFDRGNLRSQFSEDKVVTDLDIANALKLKPQLPAPFKLAIYFTRSYTHSYYNSDWHWRGEDKDKLLEIEDELISKNIITDLFVMSDSIVSGKDVRSIRLAAAKAAAKAGADAVLVVNGLSDVDKYNNILGATYFLLVTPFFVPGTEIDALFMTNATMWDVRNEYLYMSIDAEGMANEMSPAFFTEASRPIKEAKTLAVTSLKKVLLETLSKMGDY